MAKFKEGDKVRLRNDLKVDGIYGGLKFFDCMLKDMAGQIKVIDTADTFSEHYSLKGSAFTYSAEMLELAEEVQPEETAKWNCPKCGKPIQGPSPDGAVAEATSPPQDREGTNDQVSAWL